jgi:ferredoxin
MDVKSVKLVYFSPTGTSKKIAEAVARGIRAPYEHVDLTRPESRTGEFKVFGTELAVISMPVWAGRVPQEAVTRFRRLKADDTPAVLAVVYGNRAYEDALIELSDLALEAGFKPVAGGAFIGEHSYSTSEKPTAHGRPDSSDLEEAEEFGGKVKAKLAGIGGPRDIPPLELPGNRPYRDGNWDPGEPMDPTTEEELCIKCGRCAEACPTAAITVEDVVSTEEEDCVWCNACVKSCPTGARVMRPYMKKLTEWLHTNHSSWKEPETYL